MRRGRGRQDGSVDGVVHRDDTDDTDAGVTARRVANEVLHAASADARVTARRVANQLLHAAGADAKEERNPSRGLCVADAVAKTGMSTASYTAPTRTPPTPEPPPAASQTSTNRQSNRVRRASHPDCTHNRKIAARPAPSPGKQRTPPVCTH